MPDQIDGATTENSATDTSTTLLTEGAKPGEQNPNTPGDANSPGQKSSEHAANEPGKTGDEGGDQKPTPKAPEKYEFKLPEGMQLDTKALEYLDPVARKLDLSNEQAQELVDLHIKVAQEQAKANTEAWSNTTKQWVDTIKSDPEFGGKQFDTTINSAKSVLKQYADADTIAFLDQYGMGNHPGVIKMLAKIGKAMAEDTFKTGGPAAGEDTVESMARRMFPKSLATKN